MIQGPPLRTRRGWQVAELQREAARPDPRKQTRVVYGAVISYAAGNLRVRPDGKATGDVGPLWRMAAYATPVAGHRVAMLFNPDSKTYLVLGQIVNT
jgi:hypothetical protein